LVAIKRPQIKYFFFQFATIYLIAMYML